MRVVVAARLVRRNMNIVAPLTFYFPHLTLPFAGKPPYQPYATALFAKFYAGPLLNGLGTANALIVHLTAPADTGMQPREIDINAGLDRTLLVAWVKGGNK